MVDGGQGRPPRRTLARWLIGAAIAALCFTALVAIGIFLFGEFGETEARLLLTAGAVATYSLTGLVAAGALERHDAWVGQAGLATSGVGFLLAMMVIWSDWEGDDGEGLARLAATAFIAAGAVTHGTLLLPRPADSPSLRAIIGLTLTTVTVVALMLIGLVYSEDDPGEGYFRALGVVAVLMVLGTILVPILRRTTRTAAPHTGGGGGSSTESA